MAIKIFCSYAHEDEALLNKLKAQLRPLERKGLIKLWHDRDISAGTEWEHEIDAHLDTANIILLLVSPDFMNSNYCYSIEMKRALERHEREKACVVIPIILRPIDLQGVPFEKLQALPWMTQEELDHIVDRTSNAAQEGRQSLIGCEGASEIRQTAAISDDPHSN